MAPTARTQHADTPRRPASGPSATGPTWRPAGNNPAHRLLISEQGREAWRFAHVIAQRHGDSPTAHADLLGEAGLALAECAGRYCSDRGARLGTYAWPRMTGRVQDAAARESARERGRARYLRSHAEPRLDTSPISACVDIRGTLGVAAARMNAKDRLLLDRRYWGERTFQEIAKELRWSTDRTRRRHELLLGRLRHTLGLVRSANPEDQQAWRQGPQTCARAAQKRGKITSKGRDLP